MNTNRQARRYTIPTWLLVAIALAGVVGLLLTNPAGAVGAPLEEFPPPLPLDPLDPPATDWLAWAIPLGSFALIGLGLLLAAFDLGTLRSRVLEQRIYWRITRVLRRRARRAV
jgi:hypothetical protein